MATCGMIWNEYNEDKVLKNTHYNIITHFFSIINIFLGIFKNVTNFGEII
jgi:hypothetical protein